MRRLLAAALVLLALTTASVSAFAAANAAATAVWRARVSGSNTNGGGFDTSLGTPTTTGTVGGLSVVSSTCTFTDATQNFTTAGVLANMAINVPGIGQWSINSVGTTTLNLNATASATPAVQDANSCPITPASVLPYTISQGTDYSQQNSAQLSNVGTVTSATTTLTDTGASFTSAVIGNAVYISGTGVTTGYYYITAETGTTLTLNASPGTTGSAITYHIGGAWRDPLINSVGWASPGNIIYAQASGTPVAGTYGSPDYSYTTYYSLPAGSGTAGYIKWLKDPQSPAGSYPLLVDNGLFFFSTSFDLIQGYWFAPTGTSNGRLFTGGGGNNGPSAYVGNVVDLNGVSSLPIFDNLAAASLVGNEFFSSSSVGTPPAACITINNGGVGLGRIIKNNFHNIYCTEVFLIATGSASADIIGNIFSNTSGDVLVTGGNSTSATNIQGIIYGNTFDNIGGYGVHYASQADLIFWPISMNNIFSNGTNAAEYVATGTPSVSDLIRSNLQDYNSFYHNGSGGTVNTSGIAASPHDTIASSTPYTASSTQNYTLNSVLTYAMAYLGAAFPQHKSSQTTTVQSYNTPGAVQPTPSGGGGTTLVQMIL
jgi:hypothetical protein